MRDPWDRPPFPKRGNASRRALFEAIGRAIMAWEEVEISLAHLYAALCGVSRYDQKENGAYGVPISFVERLKITEMKGRKYFALHPNQQREGEFKEISNLATGYSRRRNDIAHGHTLHAHWILNPTSTRTLLTTPLEWCVVPPHFSSKKFTKANLPTYALTSREINRFAATFIEIAIRTSHLARDLDLQPSASLQKRG